ncbi:MAG: DNA primase, partial [Thermotogaceae bacterium]|nr:DNA primase [Thermotogaceae bacterium]
MIPKNVIEEIKNRLDIVDVISEYINLEKVGQYYRALCPFHTETRPSFYVSPKLQRYKCFGCGASGDVIRFVQEMENISFYEALEKMAKKAGIDLSKYTNTPIKSEYSIYT